MNTPPQHKLIIVEGLTGSGKSRMAHFIARQHRLNGIPARWIHEGELSHPVWVEGGDDDELARCTVEMFQKWPAFVQSVQATDEVVVIEAAFFNNLIETLFTHNVETAAILAGYDRLQALLAPVNPVLIYLVQDDVPQALRRNYANRGEGFVQFVIDLVAQTPYAQKHNLTGYEGTFTFWQDFVNLTNTLFAQTRFGKLRIENSAGEWERYNREVVAFLGLAYVPEYTLTEADAEQYVGTYLDAQHNCRFQVAYENGALLMNVLSQTTLVPQGDHRFAAEGWHFIIEFAEDRLTIGGQDIDYLALVGTVALREV
jgi:hypothetical protein